MLTTTPPVERSRPVTGARVRLMALCPGQTSIDLSPDVLATTGEIQTQYDGVQIKESIVNRRLTQGCPYPRPFPVKCAIGVSHITELGRG